MNCPVCNKQLTRDEAAEKEYAYCKANGWFECLFCKAKVGDYQSESLGHVVLVSPGTICNWEPPVAHKRALMGDTCFGGVCRDWYRCKYDDLYKRPSPFYEPSFEPFAEARYHHRNPFYPKELQ